jgi:predicted alpha/beta hydrolase family esterase
MSISRYIIVHGTKGSPDGNWFPWLRAKLCERGAEVTVPQMPTPEGQTLDNWLNSFAQQVGEVDKACCIIGHSIGASFLLRHLERSQTPIGASIFVAGLLGQIGIPEYDNLNQTFVSGEYNWEIIKRNAGSIVCMMGDNDPYVPLSQPTEMAQRLGVEPCIIVGGGHLNAECGYSEFPELLELLASKVP